MSVNIFGAEVRISLIWMALAQELTVHHIRRPQAKGLSLVRVDSGVSRVLRAYIVVYSSTEQFRWSFGYWRFSQVYPGTEGNEQDSTLYHHWRNHRHQRWSHHLEEYRTG